MILKFRNIILKNVGSQWLPIVFYFWLSPTFAQSLPLPFFDDFSATITSTPSTKNWQNGGGVYVNNTLAQTQLSINIATFDGRDENGVPYVLTNKFSAGETDSLVSQPIDLSRYSIADSVALSFMWLARGLGEMPDAEDTLTLQFKDNQGKWTQVWKGQIKNKQIPSKDFTTEFIAVNKVAFFFNQFQFKFTAFGRQSGSFDNWHLDYVYLDQKRKKNQPFSGNDLAVKTSLKRIFRHYTAMPMRHFLVKPAQEMADSMTVELVNIAQTARNVSGQIRFKIEDVLSQKTVFEEAYAPGNLFDRFEARKEGVKLRPLTLTGQKALLKYSFEMVSNDDTVGGVNYAANNTVAATTALDSVFAYDDGSAEFGAEIDQRFGKVSIQFPLRKEDNIKGVQMSFMPFFRNPAGENFLLQILANKNGKPGVVLSQQAFRVEEIKAINQFMYFQFKEPVAVKDTFYVAWTKIGDVNIPVGIDKSTTDFSNKIFYSTGSEWLKNTEVQGAFLVRPVVGQEGYVNKNVLSTSPEPIDLKVWPNPTSDIIEWQGDDVRQIAIYNTAGQLLSDHDVTSNVFNISHLKNGIYLLRFKGKRAHIKRIVVIK